MREPKPDAVDIMLTALAVVMCLAAITMTAAGVYAFVRLVAEL